MRAEFTYCAEDFAEARRNRMADARTRLMRHKWKLGLAFFGVMILVMTVVAIRNRVPAARQDAIPTIVPGNLFSDFISPFLPWLGLYAGLYIVLRLLRRHAGRRNDALNRGLKGVQSIDANEELLIWQNECARVEWQWASFERFRETQGLFVLYPHRTVMQVIPKRAFSLTLQTEAFRALLRTKISDNGVETPPGPQNDK